MYKEDKNGTIYDPEREVTGEQIAESFKKISGIIKDLFEDYWPLFLAGAITLTGAVGEYTGNLLQEHRLDQRDQARQVRLTKLEQTANIK
ncbi:MAG: hypothetical protein KAT77_04470 [Nanoarchaeota archaeon]|nr:hypothetical protein [Nanoarchaeota archaeon]